MMKTNLDSLFKTDSDLEKEGVWFDISSDVSFKLRRFGGGNTARVKQAMAKYHKPYAKLIEADRLGIEETNLVMSKVFSDSCLIAWKGIKDEQGNEIPCNFDNAVKLFSSLPELFNTLLSYCNGIESFKEELGNS